MDHLSSDNYHGYFQMKISSVTHGYSEWMFVPYLTFWNIALIFLAIGSCVQVFKIFNKKLHSSTCSYCNIVLLNVHFKKLNWYYCTILEYFIFSSPKLKAQVSFSGHLLSVVCLSVCLSVDGFFSYPNECYDIIIALHRCVYQFKRVSQVSNVAHGPFVFSFYFFQHNSSETAQ